MKKPKSAQPRKQRKWLAKAPLHARHKLMSAHLSDELSEKHKRRSLPVRKGDKVKIVRGDLSGHSGEIMGVDVKNYKITIQGVMARKADGTEVLKPIAPSNVVLTELDEEDRERKEALMRKTEAK